MGVCGKTCGSTYTEKINKMCIKREAHMHSPANSTTHFTTTKATPAAAASTTTIVNTTATAAAIT